MLDSEQARLVGLAVDCPICLAEGGDPCYDDQGRGYVAVHPERGAEAEALRDLALALYTAAEQNP